MAAVCPLVDMNHPLSVVTHSPVFRRHYKFFRCIDLHLLFQHSILLFVIFLIINFLTYKLRRLSLRHCGLIWILSRLETSVFPNPMVSSYNGSKVQFTRFYKISLNISDKRARGTRFIFFISLNRIKRIAFSINIFCNCSYTEIISQGCICNTISESFLQHTLILSVRVSRKHIPP